MKIQKRDFRKKFRDKYYEYYNESAPIKKSRLYTALLAGALFFSMVGLLLNFLYIVIEKASIRLVYAEIVAYIIAGIILAIGESKNVCKDYKKKLLEKSLQAIDKTFNDKWHPKNLYCKEKCIELFKRDYSKSWGYLLSKIINKTVVFLLTILFSLITYIYPGVHDVDSRWITLFFIGFLVIQYLGAYIPKVAEKIAVDYLYDRVCNDYKYYLAEQCVYGEAQNASGNEDQKVIVDSKKNIVSIGVVLFVVGLCIFPMIVWGIGAYFDNTAFASTIITYAGSIIGGGITLAGVYITIVANNRQRREDLTLQYMPVLTERIVPYAEKTTLCSEITYLFGHPLFDDNDMEFCSQQIELENVGRGEIVNCSIDMTEIRLFTASEDDLYAIKNDACILGDGFFQFIPINGKIVLYVTYPKAKEWVYEKEASLSIETTIEIVIRGIIGECECRYQLHYFLDLNYEKDEVCRSEIKTVTLSLEREM